MTLFCIHSCNLSKMSSDCGWEALAEVQLSLYGLPKTQNIYCLCSRVFLRGEVTDPATGEGEGAPPSLPAADPPRPTQHAVLPVSHSSFESHSSRPHGRTDVRMM